MCVLLDEDISALLEFRCDGTHDDGGHDRIIGLAWRQENRRRRVTRIELQGRQQARFLAAHRGQAAGDIDFLQIDGFQFGTIDCCPRFAHSLLLGNIDNLLTQVLDLLADLTGSLTVGVALALLGAALSRQRRQIVLILV